MAWLARHQIRPPAPGIDRSVEEERGLTARLDEAAGMFAVGTITGDQLAAITARLRADLDVLRGAALAAARGGLLASLPLGVDALAAPLGRVQCGSAAGAAAG